MLTSPNATSLSVAITSLEHLEAVLDAEAKALGALDFKGIDEAAHAKTKLEGRLATSLAELRTRESNADDWTPDERTQLADLRARIQTKARHNQIKLDATLRSVRGLLGALLSDAPKTYGRGRPARPPGRPVLTSAVG